MDCDALRIAFVILVKSPRLPASGDKPGRAPPEGRGLGIPSQPAAATSRAPPRRGARGGGLGGAGNFQGNTAADGLPARSPARLRRGWWGDYFWKISALAGPASYLFPPLINILFLSNFFYYWK